MGRVQAVDASGGVVERLRLRIPAGIVHHGDFVRHILELGAKGLWWRRFSQRAWGNVCVLRFPNREVQSVRRDGSQLGWWCRVGLLPCASFGVRASAYISANSDRWRLHATQGDGEGLQISATGCNWLWPSKPQRSVGKSSIASARCEFSQAVAEAELRSEPESGSAEQGNAKQRQLNRNCSISPL